MNHQSSSDPHPLPLSITSHDPNDYQILETIHSSPSIATYKARYVKSGTLLHITVFHNYINLFEDIYYLTRSIFLAKRCSNHSNIIGVYCSFTHQNQLWVVKPFADGESLSSMMNSSFHHGLSEPRIAFVLEEILKGIKRVHEHGGMLKKIDLDHVLVDKGMNIKLDFSFFSYNNYQEESSGQRPTWMEARDLNRSEKVDIWMFGLLALELFYGKIPASNRMEFMNLISRIKDSKKSSFLFKLVAACFPSAYSNHTRKMPSTMLREVIALCLDQNPLNRPTANDLLEHEFFSKRISKRL